MQTVFIMCDKNSSTYSQIIEILKEYNFSIIDDNKAILNHGSKVAVKITSQKQITTTDSLLLVLNSKSFTLPKFIGNIKVICESANIKALNFLKNSEMSVIIVGTSKTDTVTFSSISTTKALISVQRSIKNINGKIIEPCEISVNFKRKYSNSAVICAAALLLVLGIEIKDL